ncbi:MAG: allophanate hydrolase subunit 1 [Nocardioides sp.]
MRIIRVGRDAALVEVASSHEAVSLAAWARSRSLARDAVPGAETVLLDGLLDGLQEGLHDRGALAARLADWEPGESRTGPEVEVPVTYDGPDLEEVARHWGCDAAEVLRRHQATAFESAFCGFAPGFAYLSAIGSGLPEVPRLATPRTRVPAGSVALAGRWCGVYPVASPGGWQIIGRTDALLWDPGRSEPALLAPGTRVRFRAVAP